MQDKNQCEDPIHELWLVYCQLKDAEGDPAACEQIVSSARAQVGRIVNALNRCPLEPKSPGIQAANLNCQYGRQKA